VISPVPVDRVVDVPTVALRFILQTHHTELNAKPNSILIQHNKIMSQPLTTTDTMKKALGKMQTLRAGCSNAEPKNFAPLQTPFPGVQDGHNLISWKWSLPSPTDPVW